MQAERNKVVSDSIVVLFGIWVTKLKGLIVIPFLVGFVGIGNYGVYAQITANISILLPFCTLGLGQGFLRFASQRDEGQGRQLASEFWSILIPCLVASMVAASMLYLVSPWLSKVVLGGMGREALEVSSPLLVNLTLYRIASQYIQSRKQLKLFASVDLAFKTLPELSLIVAVALVKDLAAGIMVYLIVQGILSVLLIWRISMKLKWARPSLVTIRKYLRYSWPLAFASVEGSLLAKMDRYFIGYFCGPASLGVYNIIYSICSLLETGMVPLRKYFNIYLPKIWDQSREGIVKSQIRTGLLYYVIIASGFLLMLSSLTEPILTYVLKNDMKISNMKEIIMITGLGIICYGMTEFYYVIIRLKRINSLQLVLNSIGVLANGIFNVLFIPMWGILGAGAATLLGYLVNLVLCGRFVELEVGKKFSLSLLKVALCLGISYGLFSRIEPQSLFAIGGVTGLSVATYGCLVFAFKVVDVRRSAVQ